MVTGKNWQHELLMCLLVLAFTVHGCAFSRAKRPYSYEMALKNEHHDEIYNANVEWEGFTFQAPMTEPEQGCIVPGGVSTYNSIPFAVPPQVTVTWRTTDGKHHTQIVQITPDLVPGNHDILAFVFRKDNTVGVKRLAPSDFGKLLDPE